RALKKPVRSVMPLVGRNIQRACRSFVPLPFCSCCLATSVGLGEGFWLCVDTHRFRVQQIFQPFMTSCLDICPCPFSRLIPTVSANTSRNTVRVPGCGQHLRSTSSAS